jgi:hypothetical protein
MSDYDADILTWSERQGGLRCRCHRSAPMTLDDLLDDEPGP